MGSSGGFAVGVTVVPVDAEPSPWEPADPDPAPRDERLAEWLPSRRSSAEAAAFLQQITAAEAQLVALKLELALDVAAARPAPVAPAPVRHGLRAWGRRVSASSCSTSWR